MHHNMLELLDKSNMQVLNGLLEEAVVNIYFYLALLLFYDFVMADHPSLSTHLIKKNKEQNNNNNQGPQQ